MALHCTQIHPIKNNFFFLLLSFPDTSFFSLHFIFSPSSLSLGSLSVVEGLCLSIPWLRLSLGSWRNRSWLRKESASFSQQAKMKLLHLSARSNSVAPVAISSATENQYEAPHQQTSHCIGMLSFIGSFAITEVYPIIQLATSVHSTKYKMDHEWNSRKLSQRLSHLEIKANPIITS